MCHSRMVQASNQGQNHSGPLFVSSFAATKAECETIVRVWREKAASLRGGTNPSASGSEAEAREKSGGQKQSVPQV
jgi:hypothetical protein